MWHWQWADRRKAFQLERMDWLICSRILNVARRNAVPVAPLIAAFRVRDISDGSCLLEGLDISGHDLAAGRRVDQRGDMRSDCDLRIGPEGVRSGQRLHREDIERRTGDLSRIQGFDKIAFDQMRPARS